MSIAIDPKEIAREAIRYRQSVRAYDEHMNGTAWHLLDREDREEAERKQYQFEDAQVRAKNDLFELIDRFQAEMVRP